MKRAYFLLVIIVSMVTRAAFSATDTATSRISLFSTSTDWQALTGLQLNQYRGTFISDTKLVAKGLELYYLDSFPCYGLGYGVRVWVGPNGGHDGTLNIVCLYPPKQLNFAYRNSKQNADQGISTGMLVCNVDVNGRDIEINLSKCDKSKNWSEYK